MQPHSLDQTYDTASWRYKNYVECADVCLCLCGRYPTTHNPLGAAVHSTILKASFPTNVQGCM